MTEKPTAELLDELSAKIQDGWEDTDEDRRMFFEGMYHLQLGEVEEAAKVFRRATRRCEPPFDMMARMAHGRCEATRGHQGAALRIFEEVAGSDETPPRLRRLAWMEVGDLAAKRGDEALEQRARDAIEQLADQ